MTFSPALICVRSVAKSVPMSPDHSAAPYRCAPAHEERLSEMISVSPAAVSPSWTVLAFSRG